MERILVAGATGYLGRYVVKEAKKQGYYVRALARNPHKLDDISEYIDEIFEAEVTKPDTLLGSCDGIDYVISSVGITRQKDGLSYMDVDYQGNRNLLDKAVQSSVKKFIYVSVLNAHLMQYLKIIQAKERFVNELKRSGLDHCVIRPTGFFSDMLEFLTMARRGRVYLFGDGQNEINPINGSDLADVCVDAVFDKDREILIGGPDVYTYRQIAEMAFDVLGKPAKISKLPKWLNHVSLTLARTLTSSKIYGPLEFMMAVMTMDVVGELYGTNHLREFFIEKAGAL